MSTLPDPESICDMSDITVKGCDHCRSAGRYTPPAIHPIKRSFKLDPEMTIGIDGAGELWLGPDETFRRMGRD